MKQETINSYQEGLKDGFIDAMTVSQPVETGGHTTQEFLRIRAKYYNAIYSPIVAALKSPMEFLTNFDKALTADRNYQIAYGRGFDCGADYLEVPIKASQRQARTMLRRSLDMDF